MARLDRRARLQAIICCCCGAGRRSCVRSTAGWRRSSGSFRAPPRPIPTVLSSGSASRTSASSSSQRLRSCLTERPALRPGISLRQAADMILVLSDATPTTRLWLTEIDLSPGGALAQGCPSACCCCPERGQATGRG